MKTRNKFKLLIAAVFALSISANAAIINIDNFAPSAATVSGFNVTQVLSGTTRTFSFTSTGNLDGGTLDDTLSFDLIYETFVNSTFDGTDVTLGAASTPSISNINWHNNNFNPGNTLSLEVANVVYTDGEGDETAAFNGFTAINPTNFNQTPAGDIDYYVGLAGATTITGDPTFFADLTSIGTDPLFFTAGSDGPVRLRNLDFQFETTPIPEPSSVILLGLGIGGLMLCYRRRRLSLAA